jgi:type II secretory pathway predicted ATPase ExeA
MLLHYFGFQEEPFGVSPDPRRLYPSHTHREALASLQYGFNSNRGFTAMIAPPGMGKTTLLFRFLEDIRETARSVFLFDIDADCEPRDFLAHILRDIGIAPGQTSSEMHQQMSMALVRETQAGRKFVVVIDEAQSLSDAVLERVRLLTNFETSSGKLLQIVLSGQPQLSEKLMRASLVQLRQRVSTICHLEPLSAEDTVAYIDYRLKQVRYCGDRLFTDDALKLISASGQGTPRIINNLCFNSLSLCRALNKKQVDGSMVTEVIADLKLTSPSTELILGTGELADERPRERKDRNQTHRRAGSWVLASAAMLFLCALGILGLTELRIHDSQRSGGEYSLDQSATPASVPAPANQEAGETGATDPDSYSAPVEITVEPDQRLHDISVQYLGAYTPLRLHQIQALNPKLTNPDHIEIGQKIRLPRVPVADAKVQRLHSQ